LRARLLHQRGLLELRCGTPGHAYRLLLEGAAATDGPRGVLDTLILAGEAAAAAGNPDWTIAVGRLAADVAAEDRSEQLMVALLTGAAAMLRGDLAEGARLLERVVVEARSLTDPVQQLWGGRAALYLGDEAMAHDVYSGAIEQARSSGSIGLLISLLNRVAMSDAIAGRPADAITNATEGLRLARETRLEADSGIALFALALAHADRGEEDECRRHATEAQDLAETRRLPMIADGARWSLGRLELGLGRPAEALARFQMPIGVENDRYPMRFLDTADLVESAVRSGQADACRDQFKAYSAWVELADRPSQLALAARCRALLSEGKEALARYEEALSQHKVSEGAFQRARTQLVYGEALRRAKQRTAARPQLRAALETFERLGAAPWAERARHELRATGETARKRDPSTLDQLTPQELQIARLTGEGESNRDIAAQLFLSPRTVEYHLHKVFTKLGVTARGQLMRLDLSAA
ncbi:MAG: LuxR C-terminal-related transcriptional regulator, partial [Chloroflexota bacterium]|nr:LuxR C-terminal-related transcriptional regulator [Chloroflexota bacterium]